MPIRSFGTTASIRCAVGGIAAVADRVINVWFTKAFQEREPDKAAQMKQMMLTTPVDGYVACCEAIRDMDHREALPKITAPTLGHRRRA